VFARRPEDLSEFADALETTGACSNVLALQQNVEEDGTLRAGLQAYYAPPVKAAQAVPAAAASEVAGRASAGGAGR
jgi:hypothetical protein